jgi:hypothetical protein
MSKTAVTVRIVSVICEENLNKQNCIGGDFMKITVRVVRALERNASLVEAFFTGRKNVFQKTIMSHPR